jgi:hypothetical protein
LDLQAAASRFHNLMLADQPSKALGLANITSDDLDFKALVNMRRQHQTRQAATGVRTRSDMTVTVTQDPKKTERQKIIRRFHEVLKESQNDVAVGTGIERKARWLVSAKGGQVDDEVSAAASAEVTQQMQWLLRRLRQ